jgi:hypothetical protein
MLWRQLTRICYSKCHTKMPIGKSCRVVFMLCHVKSCHVTKASHTQHCFVAKRFSTCVLKSSEAPICLPILRHPILQMHSQQTKLHCSHRLFTAPMTLLSQTNCSWTEWQFSLQTLHELTNEATISDFMDWKTVQSQTDCSRTEWYCSHKPTVHGLNYDTAVKNKTDFSRTEWYCGHRQFMDWMTLQSQTDCSWTEWYCSHKPNVHGLNYDTAVTNRLFMNWMILRSQTVHGLNDTAVTDCSWTEWHCGQRVHGLNDTAVTNRLFMDWMTLQ